MLTLSSGAYNWDFVKMIETTMEPAPKDTWYKYVSKYTGDIRQCPTVRNKFNLVMFTGDYGVNWQPRSQYNTSGTSISPPGSDTDGNMPFSAIRRSTSEFPLLCDTAFHLRTADTPPPWEANKWPHFGDTRSAINLVVGPIHGRSGLLVDYGIGGSIYYGNVGNILFGDGHVGDSLLSQQPAAYTNKAKLFSTNGNACWP